MKIDEFDKKIIKKLETDGRMSYLQIADELGISNTMVHKRINKLFEKKIITKINPTFDEKALGYGFGAFTGINLSLIHI